MAYKDWFSHAFSTHTEIRDAAMNVICTMERNDAMHENAWLIEQAGQVRAETGLTPRQLAEQRAELLAALKEVSAWNDSEKRIMPTWLDSQIDDAIAKVEAAQ